MVVPALWALPQALPVVEGLELVCVLQASEGCLEGGSGSFSAPVQLGSGRHMTWAGHTWKLPQLPAISLTDRGCGLVDLPLGLAGPWHVGHSRPFEASGGVGAPPWQVQAGE